MSTKSIVLRGAAGRRRLPATRPGYLAGRAPRNKGCSTRLTHRGRKKSSSSCARPARIDHGLRIRALVAALWARWRAHLGGAGAQ
jgi:hypothetical protein